MPTEKPNPEYHYNYQNLPTLMAAFFAANPDEELATEDIAAKWEIPQRGVHTRLGDALAEGHLTRRRDGDGIWFYSASTAPAATATPPANAATLCAQACTPPLLSPPTSLVKAVFTSLRGNPRRGKKALKPPVTVEKIALQGFDIAAMQPVDGVPLPVLRNGEVKVQCAALLQRLQPGQATPLLPRDIRSSLAKVLTEQHVAHAARYVSRAVDAEHVRVWRIK